MDDINDELMEFIIKFYDKQGILPKELYVPLDIDLDLLEEYLNIKINKPTKGRVKKLVDLARENAIEQLKLKEESVEKDNESRIKAVKELAKLLNINSASRIESFDNSHLFGTYYVGGMVVFDTSNSDVDSMKEVLYRRYYKVLMEDLIKPDLIVMDGGKTQIGVCKEIIDSLGLKIKIVGLVKDNHHKTNMLMDENYNIIEVDKNSNLFLFLTRIQDEVHRFTINYHRELRSKGSISSILDNIEGIGPTRKKQLLKKYGSINKINEASNDELLEIIPQNVIDNLKKYLTEFLESKKD